MAALDDAIEVLTRLSGNALDGAQMASIAKDFINYQDAQALTNEQIAQTFMDQLVAAVKRKVRAGAASRYNVANLTAFEAAVDASIADLG